VPNLVAEGRVNVLKNAQALIIGTLSLSIVVHYPGAKRI
jgi:predicted amino acid-binding ACT domain protein